MAWGFLAAFCDKKYASHILLIVLLEKLILWPTITIKDLPTYQDAEMLTVAIGKLPVVVNCGLIKYGNSEAEYKVKVKVNLSQLASELMKLQSFDSKTIIMDQSKRILTLTFIGHPDVVVLQKAWFEQYKQDMERLLENAEKQREEQIVAFMIYGLHYKKNFYKIAVKWTGGNRQYKFWADSGEKPENSGQTIWMFLKRNGKIISNDKWVPGTDEHSSPAFWNLPMQEPEETSEFCTPKWADSGFFCLDTSGTIPLFKIVYEYPKTINTHPLLWFQPGHVVALVKGDFAIAKGTVGQIIQK